LGRITRYYEKRAVKARKIIATSLKLFYGNLEQVLLEEMSQKNFVLGRQFIIVLTDGLRKVFGVIFACTFIWLKLHKSNEDTP